MVHKIYSFPFKAPLTQFYDWFVPDLQKIAADLKISKMTLYKYLRHRSVIINSKTI